MFAFEMPFDQPGFSCNKMAAPAGRITPASTLFLLCDVQERFRNLIFNMPLVIHTSKVMVRTGMMESGQARLTATASCRCMLLRL